MAEQDRIGSLPNFLFSSDGGLLALNLGSLTFVAGLTRYAGLADIANVRILSGGLCVSLFFAMLCVYFTLIGVRATAAGRARLIARHGAALRPPLPVPGDPISGCAGPTGRRRGEFRLRSDSSDRGRRRLSGSVVLEIFDIRDCICSASARPRFFSELAGTKARGSHKCDHANPVAAVRRALRQTGRRSGLPVSE